MAAFNGKYELTNVEGMKEFYDAISEFNIMKDKIWDSILIFY